MTLSITGCQESDDTLSLKNMYGSFEKEGKYKFTKDYKTDKNKAHHLKKINIPKRKRKKKTATKMRDQRKEKERVLTVRRRTFVFS